MDNDVETKILWLAYKLASEHEWESGTVEGVRARELIDLLDVHRPDIQHLPGDFDEKLSKGGK